MTGDLDLERRQHLLNLKQRESLDNRTRLHDSSTLVKELSESKRRREETEKQVLGAIIGVGTVGGWSAKRTNTG